MDQPGPGDEDIEADQGPVMVEIEYRIDPARQDEFTAALAEAGRTRRRDGAIFWQHFVDAADPGRNVEVFLTESWLQHLRQHERVSVADREIQRRAKQYLVEGESTKSSHWLAESGP